MYRMHSAALAATLALAAGSANAAPTPLLPIDNDGAAARATYLLYFLPTQIVPLQYEDFIGTARHIAANTLSYLSAAATPAEAMRGVTVPCPVAGSLTAKLARTGARVLDVTWNGCTVPYQPLRTYDGRGRFILPSNTFSPDNLLLLQLGTRDQDFLLSTADVETDGYETRAAINLRASGLLPIAHARDYYFYGPFFYALDGFINDRVLEPRGDPAELTLTYRALHTAQNILTVGSNTRHEIGTNYDVTFVTGALHHRYGDPELGPAQGFDANNLHVTLRYVPGADGLEQQVSVDGSLDYLWDEPLRTCANGRYAFRTLEPISQKVFGTGPVATGSALMNGTTLTLRLVDGPGAPEWYTPQPGERPTRVRVNMGAAGVYEYVTFFPFGLDTPAAESCGSN